MTARRIAFAMLVLLACSSPTPSLDAASIGDLAYGAPSGWITRDVSTPRGLSVEWMPRDNDDKKRSIVIVRSERPALARSGIDRIEPLLQEALRALPNGNFSAATRFTTRHGFAGVRVDGYFVPRGQTRSYRRFHAILIVDDALVHVLATGVLADREEVDAVVDSFRRKDA